jgi:ABC-type uncharacterized transport system permease subunit
MANQFPSLWPGKKKVVAAWVLWPVVTGVFTILFSKLLGLPPKEALELAAAVGGTIPVYLVAEFVRDIKRSA